MSTKFFPGLTALWAGLFMCLFGFPEFSGAQTAGGSIVLAKCNSWVQFSVNQYSAEVVIKNIANRPTEQARVDITIGSSKTSEQIPNGGSIAKGGFTSSKTFKVVNIEKGNSGTTCDKRGPKDSDVRVYIPGNATNITSGNIVTTSPCTVCGADFNPIRQ
jgi:hypothetical protein